MKMQTTSQLSIIPTCQNCNYKSKQPKKTKVTINGYTRIDNRKGCDQKGLCPNWTRN